MEYFTIACSLFIKNVKISLNHNFILVCGGSWNFYRKVFEKFLNSQKTSNFISMCTIINIFIQVASKDLLQTFKEKR